MALFRLRALGTITGESWNFGLHGTSNNAIGDVLSAWVEALTEAWSGNGGSVAGLASLYDATTTLDTATVGELTMSSGQQTARQDQSIDLPGTAAGEPLPPQVSMVVSLQTAVANRAGRGRFYLPAPTVASVSAHVIASATIAAVAAAAGALFAGLDAGTITPVIYHRTGSMAGTVTNLTSARVGSVFDTQRRRRDKLIETYTSVAI